MARKSSRVLCFVLGLCGIFAGAPLYAQSDPVNADIISGYGLRNLQNAIIIKAIPSTPSAGDSVHFTVEGSVFDLPKDTITWSVNGKTLASGVGATSADATVDSKGDSLDVIVSVTDPVWGAAGNELVIVPLQVDILYDAPTYVPPFYRGRALPSAGGSMHLEALARLSAGGAMIPNSSITYTWSRNGTVLGSFSGLGKSKISIDSPAMYGTDTISVRASANDDTLSASASIVIPNTPLTLELYEDHPLFGITYFNALPDAIPAPSEMTVAAIPYFATITGLYDATLQYSWLLNDSPLAASSSKQNEVTLDSTQGSAKLHLDITSLNNFFLGASGDWKFQFGNSGGATPVKSGASDAFHNSNI
jgi:hypothetical protein